MSYRISPERILIGIGQDPVIKPKPSGRLLSDRVRIPEIKVRFNKGRFFKLKDNLVHASQDVYRIFKSLVGLAIETQEFMLFLFVNRRNEIIGYYKHTIGGQNSCIIEIKQVVSMALKCIATGVIMCHNHPSGTLVPSQADQEITEKLSKALKYYDISILDHLIITKDRGFYSFADKGILSGIGWYPGCRRSISGFDNALC